jgi:adenine-specific DNA-methyltransferase
MYTIGNYLKQARENLGLPLDEVYKHTNINLSLLSRIEHGKRLPTKEQVLKLAAYYKCDQHKVLVQWLSDKVVSEVQEEKFGLEASKASQRTIRYGKSFPLFPELEKPKLFALESRRYIGNKAKLTHWILKTILAETNQCTTFFDVFAGTASVAKASFPYFSKVMINDMLHSNYVIYKAFFEVADRSMGKIEKMISFYNTLHPDDLEENYFSEKFGNTFFDHSNAKLIGYIREHLERLQGDLTEKEFCILLATLIYNIDKIANTVGHFDAYIKKPIKYQKLQLRLIEPHEFAGIEIYRENANDLARKVKADIAYIDPPYNSRQYNRFYHIYENLVEWKKPELFGVALKPKPENNSLYCTTKARETFRDLVENLDVRYMAVSYNNTYQSKSSSSENKIQLEEIEDILKSRGKTQVFECAHKFFNSGKTEFANHKELLFITQVNGK